MAGLAALPSWGEWRAAAVNMDVDGRSVATYDLGAADGPTFTFLHGYPSSSLDIAPVLSILGHRWRMLTLDLPGFGASEKRPGLPLSIAAAAAAVERLWAERSPSSTVLVAHDYSVSVAQELLARRAERDLPAELTAVVWMNGGLYAELHRPTLGQQLLLDPDDGAEMAAAITPETFIDGVRGTWGTRVAMNDDDVAEMHASMAEGGGVALMHELLHYIAERRIYAQRWTGALEAGDPPATFVWGDLDPVSGAHMISEVERRVGGQPRIVRLADVGHWPPLEAPDVLAAEIDRLAPSP